MMDAFEELAQLVANWDGYGALPINPTALQRAEALCRILRRTPSIVPNNNGTVNLEWAAEGFDLEIEIGKTRSAIYFEPVR